MSVSYDADVYLRKFYAFLETQELARELSYDDVVQATTREELGVGSLEIIVLLSDYIQTVAKSDDITFKPEWVSWLNNIDGILAVLHEIDMDAQ